jgi:hypothetical protein
LLKKRINTFLQQGFSSGDLYQNPGIFLQLSKYLADRVRLLFSFVCIVGITIGTAQVAACYTNKKTGKPGK